MQHVFIIGSKGIPANYGGYETFVEKLTENQVSPDIKYHVACAVDSAEEVGEFEHNGAHCFKVLRRPVGAARAIFYDIDALKWCTAYIENNRVEHPIVYVLACRIGPFFGKYVKKMKLMLACAFSYDAKLLILDEPTSGLDPVSRDELLKILSEYIEDGEHSVLFSTHITGDLERAADYITYISYGELYFTGSKDDFVDMFRIVKGGIEELSDDLKDDMRKPLGAASPAAQLLSAGSGCHNGL